MEYEYRIIVFYENELDDPLSIDEPFAGRFRQGDRDSAYSCYDSISGCDIPNSIPKGCKRVVVALYEFENGRCDMATEYKVVLEF